MDHLRLVQEPANDEGESLVRCVECQGLFSTEGDPECEQKRGAVTEYVCPFCREAEREQAIEHNREANDRYRSMEKYGSDRT